jgi:pimeloyl-ACP methyl ester carboxylesterase
VANLLQQAGFSTLLMDLLTLEEERVDAISGRFRFDIPLLADRLIQATNWVSRAEESHGLGIGYFGASTGAAAALIAAAEKRGIVRAVVSRGGRPDLAGRSLPLVEAPTLLIVGSLDRVVIDLNREALAVLGTRVKQLEIVPGAGHLFEEPGSLERVATLASEWFARHLRTSEESQDRRTRQPAGTR